jgi:hypothetical protein
MVIKVNNKNSRGRIKADPLAGIVGKVVQDGERNGGSQLFPEKDGDAGVCPFGCDGGNCIPIWVSACSADLQAFWVFV